MSTQAAQLGRNRVISNGPLILALAGSYYVRGPLVATSGRTSW